MNHDKRFLMEYPDPEVSERAKKLFRRAPRPSRPSPESVAHKERFSAERESAEAERCRVEYEAVKERAGGRCELFGAAGTDLDPLVIHHVVYGRGVNRDRVTHEGLMIQVRSSVHKAIHADPLRYEHEMKEWAASLGLVRAWNEIERRCERCRATRAKENA